VCRNIIDRRLIVRHLMYSVHFQGVFLDEFVVSIEKMRAIIIILLLNNSKLIRYLLKLYCVNDHIVSDWYLQNAIIHIGYLLK